MEKRVRFIILITLLFLYGCSDKHEIKDSIWYSYENEEIYQEFILTNEGESIHISPLTLFGFKPHKELRLVNNNVYKIGASIYVEVQKDGNQISIISEGSQDVFLKYRDLHINEDPNVQIDSFAIRYHQLTGDGSDFIITSETYDF